MEEKAKLEEIIDGNGDVVIKSEDKEWHFTCKANRWTDLILTEHGFKIYAVLNNEGDNDAMSACYRLISAMSRNSTEDGKALITAQEVEEHVKPFLFRGCLIVAASRYSDMLEELSSAVEPSKKKVTA